MYCKHFSANDKLNSCNFLWHISDVFFNTLLLCNLNLFLRDQHLVKERHTVGSVQQRRGIHEEPDHLQSKIRSLRWTIMNNSTVHLVCLLFVGISLIKIIFVLILCFMHIYTKALLASLYIYFFIHMYQYLC